RGEILHISSPRIESIDVWQRDPLNVFELWLRGVLHAINERILFVTIDEFEEIGKRITDGKMTHELLRKTRGILQDPAFDQLILMFSGVSEIGRVTSVDGVGTRYMNPFANATAFPLKYLTEKEAKDL